MTETKRDVFEAVWDRLAGYQVFFNGWPRETLYDYKKRYDTALPDDLPVIPKAVSEEIKIHRDWSLYDEIGSLYAFSPSYSEWIDNNEDVFAEAWGRRIWRVEETGEIVKLEEEK